MMSCPIAFTSDSSYMTVVSLEVGLFTDICTVCCSIINCRTQMEFVALQFQTASVLIKQFLIIVIPLF